VFIDWGRIKDEGKVRITLKVRLREGDPLRTMKLVKVWVGLIGVGT
jgi:hypothetical protein